MSWTEAAGTICAHSPCCRPTWSGPTPALSESTGQQQGGCFWEATGCAVGFQNHTDYNKRYTKHCLVLSWVSAQGGGAEFFGISSLLGVAS